MSAIATPPLSQPTARASVLDHPGHRSLFAPDQLTFGLIMPLETYPNTPAPTMKDHLRMARLADESGFSALWMRDVPFYDPGYGDVGQVFESLVYIAALATVTRHIALGTAGIVLPIREPKILAKQVTSIDQISAGRMLLGLSSGDRPADYPLFGIDFETRGERFREAFDVYRAVTEQKFSRFTSVHFGQSKGHQELVPKAPFGRTPTIAIGRAQQSLQWIARHMDGLIAPSPHPDGLPEFVEEWRSLVRAAHGPEAFKPLGIAGYLDLAEERDLPFQRLRAGFRTGTKGLVDFLEVAKSAGVNHVALNPKVSRRPYLDLMSELAEEVLPHFPSLQLGR